MDSLCLKTGIQGIVSPIAVASGGLGGGGVVEVRASAVGRTTADKPSAPSQKTGPFRFSFRHPLMSFWSREGEAKGRRRSGLALEDAVLVDTSEAKKPAVEEDGENTAAESEGNWVLKILHVRSMWSGGKGNSNDLEEEINDAVSSVDDEDDEECDVCRIEDGYDESEQEKFQFDRESFSRLLKRASLSEAKLYAQMSYLGNLAYSVSKIKPANLLNYNGLRFVTSSAEKRESAARNEKMEVSAETQEAKTRAREEEAEVKEKKNTGYRISASAAYEIAASAASYLQSHTKSILPFKYSKPENSFERSESALDLENMDLVNSDVASLMATTNSVTAVVAAEEDVKQAVADNLKSTSSSPCEWFICDDDLSHTRFFVIQGSESLASWQANLLFEPIQFEGLDALVHRGIYEAAKGMYEQMLPEIQAHIKSHGNHAKFRFTGHSLGGSLSLLISLMLLTRGEVPASSLLPVITFGAPFVMCGGDRLLKTLGLPKSHVQSITMHRDIVPRAFSCNYPNHVAKLLKAVNGNFRSHPCLNNQKLLYAPMGELLILQPDENFSPQHDLLPPGSGLYFLTCTMSDLEEAEKQLGAAQMVFLNSPHPLEILSDRSAYGSGGTIQRDHDMNSYLKSVRSVIRQELSRIRKAKREHRRRLWWPILVARDRLNSRIIVSHRIRSANIKGRDFSGIIETGRDSLRRFSRLVASQHMHLLLVLLFPTKLLLLGNLLRFG